MSDTQEPIAIVVKFPLEGRAVVIGDPGCEDDTRRCVDWIRGRANWGPALADALERAAHRYYTENAA